ncbi:hypothetical protein I314_00347 [Cryptococcus bacillisporus CA1873]|nr:hypothetical protein I314_00347 [Cryptococcus bacillisporus CA1873]|eukprot:KIR69241.1 hypothetical protein I314_00347 [Cryptococcus gattii CA1873]
MSEQGSGSELNTQQSLMLFGRLQAYSYLSLYVHPQKYYNITHCRSEFNIDLINHMTERAEVRFTISFLSSTIAETIIAHMEDDACTWKNNFEAFADFPEAG